MDKVAILKKFRFYRESPSSLQREIERAASVASLPAGAYYFHEGDICGKVGLVGKGGIRVYKIGATGREITLYHVPPGETCLLTIASVLARVGYPATAQIELPTHAIVFPAKIFRDWINTKNEIRQFVFETIAARVAGVMALVEEIAFGKMDRRLAEFLLQRFANKGRPIKVLRLTHEQIASELGSAREVMSRLLKDFERSGAIELARGRLLLCNEDTLKKLRDNHVSRKLAFK
jgi:CRP/FNR family transcriptional regulator